MNTSTNKIHLEICIDSMESALAAQKGGADRVELCANLAEGGTTPSAGMIKTCRTISDLELYVMIRPRSGDFCYSPYEFEIMREDIQIAKKLGADGVVFGLLLPNGEIDLERTKELVQCAAPMNVTFHRAFDMCKDPLKGLEDLIQAGVYRILTSGQKQTAWEGQNLLRELGEKAGNRIKIMAGAGINPENLEELLRTTNLSECHLSAKSRIESPMEYRNPNVYMGGIPGGSEYEIYRSDINTIREIKSIINKI
ncbi:MAG: copper homeostasis protein CutC [Marinifilaceae bacterium]